MRRRGVFSLPHAVLVLGIVVTTLTMYFGSRSAESSCTPKTGSPGDVTIYPNAQKPGEEPLDTLEWNDVLSSYKTSFPVKFDGKSAEKWSYDEGGTIRNILLQRIDEADVDKIKLVTIRPDVGDSYFPPTVARSFYLSNSHPLVVVTESDSKSMCNHFTRLPILVPFQYNSKSENGEAVRRLSRSQNLDIQVYSGSELDVEIKKTDGPDSKGNYTFKTTKSFSGADYKWVIHNDGTTTESDTGRTFKTTKLTPGSANFLVTVEVTQDADGVVNFGSDDYSLVTKSESDGNTDNDKSGATDNTGGGGGGSTNSSGSTGGTGSSTYKPPKYNPPKSTIPPVTPSTGSTDTDDSGLSQAVAGLRGTGTARAVSGVLLSTPATTSNPAAGGGDGKALERLAGPLASAANDVFQPINDTQDLWRFMLAVMFATGIFGGIREYRKP